MARDSFEKIRNLIKIIGGKVVVVENEKPILVIIDADEYIGFQNIENSKSSGIGNLSERDLIEKINNDINIWKGRQEERRIGQIENNLYAENVEKDDKKTGDEIIIERL